jgi:hypothetical protein
MVIHDFHPMRVIINPFEANTPLIIDANPELPLPLALQRLEPIARRASQIVQTSGFVKIL